MMKHTKTFILLAFAAFLLFACSKEEPTPEPQPSAVPQIILDTDIASSTDDLFAMQLLYRCAAQGRCKLLGVVVDRMGGTDFAPPQNFHNADFQRFNKFILTIYLSSLWIGSGRIWFGLTAAFSRRSSYGGRRNAVKRLWLTWLARRGE